MLLFGFRQRRKGVTFIGLWRAFFRALFGVGGRAPTSLSSGWTSLSGVTPSKVVGCWTTPSRQK
ncbi:hypothetical protein ABIA33_003571 [Streptacidiphilus sp. MAP12-16]|uniref:hypothetical protein n=1 Tax=Streptacidiphilus sp. MAP12-16 TaxID=3156300 RepID=UPI003518F541